MPGITHRTFVSYIDRTRDYYGAQGYERPYAWARHTNAPFAPLAKPLAQCRVAVITTASPWREDKPVDGVLRGAKQVWSGETASPPERLFTDDLAWDKQATHTRDVESFLPLARLRELAGDGRIAGLTARFHGAPTDYSQRRTTEQDAPEILARCRADAADVALLVPL
jgi:D-proline reductase (dithiol) PrdB